MFPCPNSSKFVNIVTSFLEFVQEVKHDKVFFSSSLSLSTLYPTLNRFGSCLVERIDEKKMFLETISKHTSVHSCRIGNLSNRQQSYRPRQTKKTFLIDAMPSQQQILNVAIVSNHYSCQNDIIRYQKHLKFIIFRLSLSSIVVSICFFLHSTGPDGDRVNCKPRAPK